MRRRATRRGLEPTSASRTRHRQAAQPGAGPHGTVPPPPGGPGRHGAPARARPGAVVEAGPKVWLGSDGENPLDAYRPPTSAPSPSPISGSWRRHIASRVLARAIRTRLPVGLSPDDDLHHHAYDITDNVGSASPKHWNLGLPHQNPCSNSASSTATLARVRAGSPPNHRDRRRHPHLPHLLILRRPRQSRRSGAAITLDDGIVPGSAG